MLELGAILKLQTESTGTNYYRVIAEEKNMFTIKPICKIRKGFLNSKFVNAKPMQILKSEVGINYLKASKREILQIKEIMNETEGGIDRAG